MICTCHLNRVCRNIKLLLLDLKSFLEKSFLYHLRCNRTKKLTRFTSCNNKRDCNIVQFFLKRSRSCSLFSLSLCNLLCFLLEHSCICLVVNYCSSCREEVVSSITVFYCYDVAFFSEMYYIVVENDLHFFLLVLMSKKFSMSPRTGSPKRTTIFSPGINRLSIKRTIKSVVLFIFIPPFFIQAINTEKPCIE